jgi:long-chain acyl-CoA synthetase
VAYQVNDSGAVILILEHEFIEYIDVIRQTASGLKYIFVAGEEPVSGTIPFPELLGDKKQPPLSVPVDESESAVILYTSGTTGKPKGALLTCRGLIASAMNMAHLCDLRSGRDKILIVVPLFHITGLATTLCSAMYAGIPAVIVRKYRTVEVLKMVADEKITVMVAVPTIFWMMLNAPEFGQYDMSSLRFLAAGGSAIPEDLVKGCAQKLPWAELAPGYGLTEANGMTHSTTSLAEALRKPGSVGLVTPLMDAKVVDGDGKELHPGQPGELLVKGCQVMKGYWNNPAATAETLTDGWLHTGDIAIITEDGYTYIFDRIKDMIIRGGENIYCIEIENTLYRDPKVLEAAVVGVPDRVFGEQVKAVLVLKPGESATPEEIQEFCGQYLADYKIPRYVEFRDSLPRNPSGKVVKGELK